jgi:hypothetical protein
VRYRYARIIVAVALAGALGTGAFAQTRADERLFEEAKVLIFDKNWEAAQAKLDSLLREFPETALKEPALFYRAKCLGERRDRAPEAFEAYEGFLRAVRPGERNASLAEDAEVSLIDLAYGLYEKGERSKLPAIEDRLRSPNKVVRYYAAFKLSYIKDKGISGRAIPILKGIVEGERDPELRDRARIALLRVDPGALREVGDDRREARSRLLRIQVLEGGKKKVDINIPWALADLALQAIPDEERTVMRRKGYDLDRIINELAKTGSSIIEINEEGSVIRIWIE